MAEERPVRLPIASCCFVLSLCLSVAVATAQEPPTDPAPPAAEAEAAESADTPAPESSDAEESPAEDDSAAEAPAAEESTPDDSAEEPAEEPATAPEPDTADDDTNDDDTNENDAEKSDDADADESDDVAEAEDAAAAKPGRNWGALARNSPKFLGLLHHAAVHLPIALWLFGALFVVIGVFAPSLRTQIPLASLLLGTVTAVAATATGWWYAEHNWGETWTWGDGFGDFSEHLVKHRWTAVALLFSASVLSLLAIISQAKRSKALGVVWRVGLLCLAAGVAWEGHIGGELIHGEGFLEDAFQEWVQSEE